MSVFFKDWGNSSEKTGEISLYIQEKKDGSKGGLLYHLDTEARKVLNGALEKPMFNGNGQVRVSGDVADTLRKFIAIIEMDEERAEAFKEASTKDMSEAEKAEFEETFAKIRKIVFIDKTK
jgi:hypothetical protein